MRLQKICAISLVIALCLSVFQQPMISEADTGVQIKKIAYLIGSGLPGTVCEGADTSGKIICFCYNNTDEAKEITISSTNTNVVKITSPMTEVLAPGVQELQKTITYQTLATGVAEIVVTLDGNTYRRKIYVVSGSVRVQDIQQTGYDKLTITWNKVTGCSGYILRRKKAYQSDAESEEVATLYGADKTKFTVRADLYVPYTYHVQSFVQDGNRKIKGPQILQTGVTVTRKLKTEIQSVRKTGSSQLTIQWKPIDKAKAVSYELYRATKENGTYKRIYKTNAKTTSYKDRVKKGVTYYYKLKTTFSEGEGDLSGSVGQYIPTKSKKRAKGVKYTKTEYLDTYQCISNGNMYMVGERLNKKVLDVYKMTSTKVGKRIKSIKMGKNSEFGCAYAGPDGNIYVAIGYPNYKESLTETVIKVTKYNNNWEKTGTAYIKGGATNVYKGICEPFRSGRCRMDMQGNTLVIHTSRLMFKHSDGKRHQSNISFEINTKTMKVTSPEGAPYVSHSFNQFVKFKDGSIYYLDLGDGYPRSATLKMQDDYEGIPVANPKARKTVMSGKGTRTSLIRFKGATGDNYTGCTLRGMEVGQNNVVACGIMKLNMVKGVSGLGKHVKRNIFIATCNRKTGETAIRWLIPDKAENSSIYIDELAMVKLSDNRFAVMYFTRTKSYKYKLHYLVVDDSGNTVFKKTYSGFSDTASTFFGEPVLYKGSIVWTANVAYVKKPRLIVYSIPARVK